MFRSIKQFNKYFKNLLLFPDFMLSAETIKMNKKQYLPLSNEFSTQIFRDKQIFIGQCGKCSNKHILRTLRVPNRHLIPVADTKPQRSQRRCLRKDDFCGELEGLNKNLPELGWEGYMVIYNNIPGIDLCSVQGKNKRQKCLKTQAGRKYGVALYPIEKVLRGEVTGTDTVLSICHFDSSEQREAVCQAGEEGPRQYKGSRNGQEKDEGNIYGDHSVGLNDFLDMGRV